MKNGSGARGGAGTECSPHGQADAPGAWAVWFVSLSFTAGFVTWDRPSFNPVEWKMG